MTSGGNWCEYFKVISVSASVVIEKSYIPWFIKHWFYLGKIGCSGSLNAFPEITKKQILHIKECCGYITSIDATIFRPN